MSLRFVLALAVFFLSEISEASKPSYVMPHPLAWIYALPRGETPGWKLNSWFNLEVFHANVWNPEIELLHARTGKKLTYEADYEISGAILDAGYAPVSFWAFGFEIPYSMRRGGFLDQTIDGFHDITGGHRFERQLNPRGDTRFRITVDGEERITDAESSHMGFFKLKSKLWLFKWGKKNSTCACGLSASVQFKLPSGKINKGFSSEGNDVSHLVHFGIPIRKHSAVWITAASTRLDDSPLLKDWPVRKWQQMYELSLDFGLSNRWGVVFSWRMESPILNKSHLAIRIGADEAISETFERISSSWLALTHWRGSQALGARYQPSKNSQFHFLFTEDWAYGGGFEEEREFYVNNAPDIALNLQAHFNF